MTDNPGDAFPSNSAANQRRWSNLARRYREWFVASTGFNRRLGTKTSLLAAVFIFTVSFVTKSLHAADIAPIMHTVAQEQAVLSSSFYWEALSILQGHGVLVPDNVDSADTSLVVHAPGYSIFQAAIYALFGGSYYTVQLIQNLLNSVSPVLIFLIASMLFGSRVGLVSGLLLAASHHLSYYSNVILPDSLCALPIIAAVYVLLVTKKSWRWEFGRYAIAGALLGVSIWLRPNLLLIGPFMAVLIVVTSTSRRRTARRTWILALVPLLLVAPITVRNWIIYRQFVLVSANTGIVLWEGIADESGDRFGAVSDDVRVAQQEATLYNNPSYAGSWSYPDGIKRDRDRIKRSLGIILRHPFWFAGAMTRRMGSMLKYSAGAPLLLRRNDSTFAEAGEMAMMTRDRNPKPDEEAIESDREIPELANKLAFARTPLRALQRLVKESAQAGILLGAVIVGLASWRRAVLISSVPLYYLLIQSAVHTEFRYTLPMHYFLFIFAAVVWVVLFEYLRRGIKAMAVGGNQHKTLPPE